jgi:hypothetical protein
MDMPFTFDFEFRDENGVLIARRTCRNLVTTAGKNLVGNVFFGATAKSATWYVGLKGSGTAAAADTIPSHAGWSEITAYSQTVRQTLTMSSFSGGSATNSGSPAVFTINAGPTTVAGAFIVDSNVKGGTTLGTLYNVADFSAPVTLSAGTVTVNGIVLGF